MSSLKFDNVMRVMNNCVHDYLHRNRRKEEADALENIFNSLQ